MNHNVFWRRLLNYLYSHVSLRNVLIVPFVCQICGTVGLVGYLSFINGQKAVNDLVIRLQNEISHQVDHHLDTYLNTPKQINQINVDAINLGMLNLEDFQTSGKYFWKQMQVFNVGYINYANTKGEFIGVERLNNGKVLLNEVSAKNPGKLYVYTTDNEGNPTKLTTVKNYDPRLEAWYADAVKAGKPIWSQIYQWEDKPEILSISSSYPLYDQNKQLVGVIGVDLILSQIKDFLQEIEVGRTGKIFIIEPSGLIVASSNEEQPYTVINKQVKRLS
ncbi:MAG: cache domain-containing protein, partial [Nostocaceae cyanobacterium]|nr:cache domain-containing protein [Nostocaceae cyanobacterium]